MSVTAADEALAIKNELIALVTAVGPKLRERAPQGTAQRKIPAENIADLVATGALRACLPKRWGGFELPFGAHSDVALEIARYDGSTGWVAGIIGSHNWWLGKFNPAAQEEILSGNPNVLVAAAFASKHGSLATPVDGGYRLTGEWIWTSGVDHCSWCGLMAPVPNAASPLDMQMLVLKRGEYTIKDLWYAPGMKATGSNNVVVEDVFVPAGRATRIGDLNNKASPGQKLNDGWTYRLPMLQVFAYSIVGPIIGCARGALDAFVDQMSTRKGHDGTRMADLQSLQLRVAESSAELDAAEALYRSDIAFVNTLAKTDGDLTPQHVARIARNCGFIANLCRRSGLRLVEALGATGTEDSNPVQRAFDDTLAGAAHRSLGWDLSASNFGKLLLSGGAK